ncbi:MAG: pentapeptide repeat-containing protein [Planctomycetes bacterium]|nr:pentapeptide repeat-containing protein [Planctomycetota bacterium]
MSDRPSIHQTSAGNEEPALVRASLARWLAAVMAGLAALLLILVCINLWLLHRSIRTAWEQDQARLFWLLCQDGSTPAERARAFLRLAASGNRQWRCARLEKLRLSGVNLPRANLQYANFSQSDLSRADLAEARLRGCLFQAANLAHANLQKADLTDADLLKADLTGANLREAILRAASLEQATVRNANLILADLSEAHLLMADLSGANLTGADLTGANLESASFRGAELALSRLNGANLTDADFSGSNWWRARGLTARQLARLRQRFAPSDEASANRRRDFQLWLKAWQEANGEPAKPRPP